MSLVGLNGRPCMEEPSLCEVGTVAYRSSRQDTCCLFGLRNYLAKLGAMKSRCGCTQPRETLNRLNDIKPAKRPPVARNRCSL